MNRTMMKLKRMLAAIAAVMCLSSLLAMSVSAEEYSFTGAAAADFYPSVSYEDAYGARYSYGGPNVADFSLPELPYGKPNGLSIGAKEKVYLPGQLSYGSIGFGNGVFTDLPALLNTMATPASTTPSVYRPTAYTSVEGMVCSDGSIGTIHIPSLNISMKVWEGETNESMAKGLGHYTSTSAWDGNCGVCGHNRGARYVIGSIKNLQIGDTITYETVYGTRTYSVSYVGTISNTDWSHLQATADNRITITTCLADQPAYRVCVQAVEVI